MSDHTDQPTPDELFAVLAREVRTPLATIEGYLELLTNGDVGSLSVEQREYLDVVSRNVQRLMSVVGDWAEISRLEAGRVALAREPVDLGDIIDLAVAAVRPGLRVKEQRLRVETPDEPIMALGDTRALQRVVDNLLSNANKYTAPHGTIRVVASLEGADRVRLDVVDTGIGLREEDQARLFRKFFRSSLTEAEPGSGLGLPICRSLMELMDGSIRVISALGQGSTFSIELPRADVPGADVPASEPVGVAAFPAPMPATAAHAADNQASTPHPVGSCSQA